MHEAGRAGCQIVDPARPGGNPQAALQIQRQRVQVVAAEAGRIVLVVRVQGHGAAGAVDMLQAAPGRYPHAVGAVADDLLDHALARRPGRQGQGGEVARCGIEARHAVLGPGPDLALQVFEQRQHPVARQAALVARIVPVVAGLVAVIPLQPGAIGADSDEALAVLQQGHDRQVIGIERAKALEAQVGGGAGRRHAGKGEQATPGKQAQQSKRNRGKHRRSMEKRPCGRDATTSQTLPFAMFPVNKFKIYCAINVANKAHIKRGDKSAPDWKQGLAAATREQGAIYMASELGYGIAFCKSIDASRMSAASGAARHCGAAPISFSSRALRAAAGDAHDGSGARACRFDVTNLFKKAGARRANQT